MNLKLIALQLVALASCRPDASYLPPSSSYLPTASDVAHKHVYFYGSSDDDQHVKYKINVLPSSHKSTKIIFVKAPSQKVIPEVFAPHSQVEDKTLVYVLTKNPQDGSITIPTALHVNKIPPKVYFIKYNNKGDAAPSVNAGTQGEPVGSPVSNVDNENAFLGTLNSGDSTGYGYGYGYGSPVVVPHLVPSGLY
ncbi:hypothetical protein RI129_006087 [Pyrocoelia pectoralis]|uniref:DUF243 domain-containing protein n=1 Tax=Pyrocoelia pectoralis TaxID=417401 RepID=A0AAN7VBV8_9COLE